MILSSSYKAYTHFGPLFSLDTEEVWVAALNANLDLIESKLLFKGTVDQCTIYPRDILRFICLKNASRFMLAHNHPSGHPLPSPQDRRITKNIEKLALLVEIPLCDHLIIAGQTYFSFADHGLLKSSPH